MVTLVRDKRGKIPNFIVTVTAQGKRCIKDQRTGAEQECGVDLESMRIATRKLAILYKLGKRHDTQNP